MPERLTRVEKDAEDIQTLPSGTKVTRNDIMALFHRVFESEDGALVLDVLRYEVGKRHMMGLAQGDQVLAAMKCAQYELIERIERITNGKY